MDKLKKIKVSGVVQAQYRFADTTDKSQALAGKFQGGEFPSPATNSVFSIRRARIKVAYETDLSQLVVQFDAQTKGIGLKDAYLRFTEPFLKSLSLKGGLFDRPFGFEISYSSSTRESPERSRVFQTLFPGERDMGVSLEYTPTDLLPYAAQLFNFKGGIFAGNGINNEYDDIRDYIARAGFAVPLNDFNMSVEGGVSTYQGAVKSLNDSLYTEKNGAYVLETGYNKKNIDRNYMGYDLELYYGDVPFFGGMSLRGEYLHGTQPGSKSSSESPKKDVPSTSPIYGRDFNGYYLMGVLNVNLLRSQLVAKYDVYNPATEISTSKKDKGDVKFTTIGGGWIYHWDENIKFVAYYDKIENEKITKAPYTKDLSDDVFTFRVQYKF